jgi:hypothetical protein
MGSSTVVASQRGAGEHAGGRATDNERDRSGDRTDHEAEKDPVGEPRVDVGHGPGLLALFS